MLIHDILWKGVDGGAEGGAENGRFQSQGCNGSMAFLRYKKLANCFLSLFSPFYTLTKAAVYNVNVLPDCLKIWHI